MNKPVTVPAWVLGPMLLAAMVIDIAFGVGVYAWFAMNGMHDSAFTDQERAALREEYSDGTFVSADLFRVCINRQWWYFHPGGLQDGPRQACWK